MEGYAQIAARMSRHPNLAMVRGFKAVAIQNILYLQAELHHLESEYHKVVKADKESGSEDSQIYSRDWYTLSRSIDVDHDGGAGSKQWSLVLQIREVLEKYNTAIAQQAFSQSLAVPPTSDIDVLSQHNNAYSA